MAIWSNLGRLDHQVKIRGFRIELGEIEAALCQHPVSQKALVVAREMPSGDKRLVGIRRRSRWPTAFGEQSRQFLKERLPAHAVPSSVVLSKGIAVNPER
jgi:acyl-coenzyme A synthetase/AMP-(fatty) acid ligase